MMKQVERGIASYETAKQKVRPPACTQGLSNLSYTVHFKELISAFILLGFGMIFSFLILLYEVSKKFAINK